MTEVHLDPQGSAAPPADAAAVGAQLRRVRENRGETTGDVAHALKLTSRQIEAMEAGRLDLLPGPAFARGFLRNYARYLGVDPAAVLIAFEFEAGAQAVELLPVSNAEGVMPTGGASRAVQIPAALVAGVLLVAVIAGWYFDWFQMPGEPVAVTEQVSEPASPGEATHTSEAVAVPAPGVTSPAVGSVSPVLAPMPAPPAVATATAPMNPIPVAPVAPAGAPAADSAPPANVPAIVPPAPVVEAPRTDGVAHMVFRFGGESWVEVRDASGAIVYSGISNAGSTRTVQGKPPFALVVGNARQVSLEYRGKPYDLSPHVRVSVARLTLE